LFGNQEYFHPFPFYFGVENSTGSSFSSFLVYTLVFLIVTTKGKRKWMIFIHFLFPFVVTIRKTSVYTRKDEKEDPVLFSTPFKIYLQTSLSNTMFSVSQSVDATIFLPSGYPYAPIFNTKIKQPRLVRSVRISRG
jgi:hypothetical protein